MKEWKKESIPQEPIKVTPDMPFRLPENFRIDQSIEQDSEIVEIGSIELDIEGGGKGRMRVLRITDDGEWHGSIRTPLGPIISTQVRNNNEITFDPNSSPLIVEIIVKDIADSQAESMGCTMWANDSQFIAKRDNLTIQEDSEGRLLLIFDEWIEVETNEKSLVWFPQDPDAKGIKEGLQFALTLE